jgi:subtilisin family serine protease
MVVTHRIAGLASGIATVLVVSAATAIPAAADPATDGFWYFDLTRVSEAHDAGVTGAGITIAVIDSQVNLEVPTLQGADIQVQPSMCWDDDGSPISPTSTDLLAEHGTNIVSYLVGTGAGYAGQTGVKGVAPDATILYFNAGRDGSDQKVVCNSESGEPDEHSATPVMGRAIVEAVDAGADIISVSLTSAANDYVKSAVAHALHEGVVVVSGVPNAGLLDEGFDIFQGFPAAYNGVVGVQAGDVNGRPEAEHVDPATEVLGPGVNLVWQGDSTWEAQRYATGTSLATPIIAGYLALVADKYPDATGNQLIQTLIRNTGADDHELFFDPTGAVGYGSASISHMLRVDPTTYEDSNPLVLDDPVNGPTRDEIENAGGSAEPSDEPGQTDEPSVDAGSSLWPLLAAVGGGLLVIALIVTLIIVLATRRSRATRPSPPA